MGSFAIAPPSEATRRRFGGVIASPPGGAEAVSLADALAVLDLFTAGRRSLKLGEIVEATGQPPETCSEAVRALSHAGLLAPRPPGDGYMVGIRSLELAYAYERETPLVELCMPFLHHIRDRVDETAMLAVRWGDYRVNIAQVTSTHPVHQEMPEGERRRLYIGAGGKVLLAGMSDEAIAAYLDRVPLERLSPTTPADRSRLLQAVEAMRTTGYSECFIEGNEGGASIGTAIRDAAGRIVAALVVAAPIHRYTARLREQVLQLLMSGADEISDRLSVAPVSR
jgi:IclR family pca regulon transcriptional regulator